VTARYVFDTGALISAERGKARAARFLQLVRMGQARIIIPMPVIAEWWRGRTDARQEILATGQVSSSLEATKSAGVALARLKGRGSKLTIDAIVMATAALNDAVVVTGDPQDFELLSQHFPGVGVISA
jgi:predicted nucleic acid-binding protein